MNGSGTVHVLKRDGSTELFDAAKLAVTMWRAMKQHHDCFDHARQLAEAIGMYLAKRDVKCASSRAVFEMAVKAFEYIGVPEAAKAMESYRTQRDGMRRCIRVRHENGSLTFWEKGWLKELAIRSWYVSPTTARIIASDVEMEVLRRSNCTISRQEVLEILNHTVAAYGLADAVPVDGARQEAPATA